MKELSDIQNKNITDEKKWPCEVREYYVKQQPIAKFMKKFVRYVTTVNSLIGTVFNIINIIYLPQLINRSSFYIHLTALAVVDLGNCLLNFGQGCIRVYFKDFDDLFVKYKGFCIFHSICIDFFSLVPVWLVCIVTGQKLISITWPLKASIYVTRNRVKKVVFGTYFVAFVWSMYKIPSAGSEANSSFGYQKCRDITLSSFVMVSQLLMSYLPASLCLILNFIILYQLKKSNESIKKMTDDERDLAKRANKTTKLILVVSFAFVLLVGPQRVFIMFGMIVDLFPTSTHWRKVSIDMRFARQFGFVLYQLNFVTNFLLYISTDENFKNMVLKRKPTHDSNVASSGSGKNFSKF